MMSLSAELVADGAGAAVTADVAGCAGVAGAPAGAGGVCTGAGGATSTSVGGIGQTSGCVVGAASRVTARSACGHHHAPMAAISTRAATVQAARTWSS
jgi:hypothetical protein